MDGSGVQRQNNDQFEITKYVSPYTYVSIVLSQDNTGLDSNLIANEILDLVNKDPKVNIQAIGAFVKTVFNCTTSYRKLWIVKQKAMAHIFGSWDTSYQELPKWMRALQDFNPGSCVKFVTKEANVSNCVEFDYIFWIFGPSIEGFKHCRHVISIDGTHLYGKYEGKY